MIKFVWILHLLRIILIESPQMFFKVSKSRGDMEQQTIEAASTSEAVNFITYVQGLKRKMKSWEKQVNLYREGQRILERQRFQFPSSWLHVDNIEVSIHNTVHVHPNVIFWFGTRLISFGLIMKHLSPTEPKFHPYSLLISIRNESPFNRPN